MQARYSFADSVNVGTASAPVWVRAGIRGDGRTRNGLTAASGNLGGEYQGSFCGVSAVLGRGAQYDENIDFTFNSFRYWADTLPASCKPARGYRFYLDGLNAPPRLLHPLSIVGGVGTMAVGEVMLEPEVFQTGDAEVGGIRFVDNTSVGTSSVQVTRLPDIRDDLGRPVRQWRIESRDTHRALNLGDFSVTYYLPFSLTVTEVPYPFPAYP